MQTPKQAIFFYIYWTSVMENHDDTILHSDKPNQIHIIDHEAQYWILQYL